MKPASMLIVADDISSREKLRELANLWPDLYIVTEAETVEASLALATATCPDAVILDLQAPLCALDAARRMVAAVPASKVIVLSAYADFSMVGQLLGKEMRQVGVTAFLPKGMAAGDLIDTIQLVVDGQPVFPSLLGFCPTQLAAG